MAETKALACVHGCESKAGGAVLITFDASFSDKINLPNLIIEIDRTKSTTQLNNAVRQAAMNAINADTPSTISSLNDIFLAGGFVN